MTDHFGPTVARNGDLRVIDCIPCAYAHLDPLPHPESVRAFYASDDAFYAEGGDAWFEKERAEHAAGLWDAGYRFQAGLLDSRYLVDLGAGAGWFVEWWNINVSYVPLAFGVEPSKRARCAGRVRGQLVETIGDFAFIHRVLGPTITSQHSARASLLLEHLPDPLGYVRGLTTQDWWDGRLLIITPNEFNPLQKILARRHGDWFVCRHHINYFTPASLTRLLAQAGLEVKYMGATFPMELMGLVYDYVANDTRGRRCHAARLRLERAVGPGIFSLYGWLLRRFGWGRELLVMAERINE